MARSCNRNVSNKPDDGWEQTMKNKIPLVKK